MTRRAPRVAAALAAAFLLAGCTPDPAPSPTPTPAFASDAEAYAAAEATYRAYVDALNAVDLSDPRTFEPVYAWTTGDANASAKETFSQMYADGWSVSGDSTFGGLRLLSVNGGGLVLIALCLDVSTVEVRDSSGASVVPDARLDRQPVEVTLLPASTSSGLAISESKAAEDQTTCA